MTSPDLTRVAAETLGKHGYDRTPVGHECPCGHVYAEQPPGAYMEPDRDWLDGAILDHRAAAVVAALLDALGAETRAEWGVRCSSGVYAAGLEFDARLDLASNKHHNDCIGERTLIRRAVVALPSLVGEWREVGDE